MSSDPKMKWTPVADQQVSIFFSLRNSQISGYAEKILTGILALAAVNHYPNSRLERRLREGC